MIRTIWRSAVTTVLGISVVAFLSTVVAVPAAHASVSVDNQPPAAPVLSYVVAYPNPISVLLNWVASTDNNAVRAYEILRGNYYSDEQVIARVDGSSTSYVDSTPAPFANTYRVRALDKAGNVSDASNPKTAIVHPDNRSVPPPPGYTCIAEYHHVSIKFPTGGRTSVNIFLTNFGPAIDGWQLTWTFPGDVTIDGNIHGATIAQDGKSVVATSIESTAVIATGGTVQIDFAGAWTTTPLPPVDFMLNSNACVTG